MPAYECTHCGNTDVRKVSAVYDAETWTSTSQGTSTGFERTKGGKIRPKTRHYTEHHSGASQLAKTLAPPEKPVNGVGFIVVGCLVLLLALWGTSAFVLQNLVGATLGNLLGVVIVAVVFSWLWPAVQRSLRREHKRYEEKRTAWEKKCKRWEELFYCPRCDYVYNPDTGRSAPAKSMDTLL